MDDNENFLLRCSWLAGLADGQVMDNPRVGAVLVHEGRIIGEGYHRVAGKAHAEVNCLASVRPADHHLIPESTLYVSLEPCCITGRSGACTNVIKEAGIRKVVFAQRDATPGVDGESVRIMNAAGISVLEYPDFKPTQVINAQREVMATKGRPFITLKFARSLDGFLRPADRSDSYWITNPISRRLVHRWRANTSAILVGGRTVAEDDPSLTTRLFPGQDARAVIIDPRNRVTGKEQLFRKDSHKRPLLFAGTERNDVDAEVIIVGPELNQTALTQVLSELMKRRLGRLTVEGGAGILQAFLSAGLWDEARVFTGDVVFGNGVPAPNIPTVCKSIKRQSIGTDSLQVFTV